LSNEEIKEEKYCAPCAADAIIELGKDICKITKEDDEQKCGQILAAVKSNREELTVKDVDSYTESLSKLAKKYDDKAGIEAMKAVKEVVHELDEGKR